MVWNSIKIPICTGHLEEGLVIYSTLLEDSISVKLVVFITFKNEGRSSF